uniref:Uncharacterized protein n=1 Tax=Aegilops tauschii subsp. strangulata TaxID=200361 RepID=A0A452Y8I9_AEGTS
MVSRGPNLNGGVIYTQFVCLKDATTCKNNFAGQVVKPLFYCCGIVSLHGAAAWRGGQQRTCEATINTADVLCFPLSFLINGSLTERSISLGVQTPNCIRRTIYDVVALDYEKVTVFIDATVVARPNIHLASIRDMRTIVVERPTLEEWRRCVARGVFHSWHRSGIHA